MAFIGLRFPVCATLTAHTEGSEPTYGTGKVIGKAIQANLTITRNNNPLYADDVIAEDDNSVTGMSLELGLDDLTEEVRVYMLGLKEKTITGQNAGSEYIDTDESAPYVGFGYIRVRRKEGTTSYQGVWCYKVLFSEESENSNTKGESIEWQTPTLTGRIMGLNVGGNGERSFRKKRTFTSESDAVAWLKGLAGISA